MTPFDPAWKSGITIAPSLKKRYRLKGLVPIERQATAITIIPRARARQDNDKRDALKRTISMKEQT
jgi:hypothetical protein